MFKKIVVAIVVGTCLAASVQALAQTGNSTGKYASVNGLKMYYEIHGTGQPLVLLHGGVAGIEMLRPILPALSEKRQVIAVDLLRQDYDWSKEVAGITAPTMIVFADADAMRTDHVMEFFGLLGGGKKDAGFDGSGRPAAQLATLPGFTHYNLLMSPALVPIATQFLDAPMPQAN